MDPDKELRDVQEQSLTGWDKERARETISRTLRLVDDSTKHVEAHLGKWIQEREQRMDEVIMQFLHDAEVLRDILATDMDTKAERQRVYRDLSTSLNHARALYKIVSDGPVQTIKMARDLVDMVDRLIRTTEKVVKITDQLESALEDREQSSLVSALTPEQLLTVLAMVEENKGGGAS